ncbi:MAG: ABC transporter permease [Lachnospiraceae bacterium]|jgi:NitT/TauT family transport system permease protein|nr:ABC transporter permease [Lachnospiraceae bacterium]MDE6990688.1 ABC transporter permease [Lachnospiraceae bacterium]MDE7001486.1 ABC transporter permease [Lachnospiraceae bacterium]
MKTQKNDQETNIRSAVVTTGQKNFLRRQKLQKLYIFWSRILIFAAFLMLWQVSADFGWIDSFYFSSPTAISRLFWHDITDMSLLSHIGITLLESGVSFLLIIVFSVLIATFFWFYPSLGKMFEPFLIVLNSLPKSALAPLIIVWLGTGPRTIILCGISVGIFGCILNLYQSFAQTDPERLKLIETLGGTKLQAFTKVVFPGNIPTFISLSKVNIGLALVGVIIGEFLAGRKGLGYLIIYGSQVFKLDMVILSIVILCVIAMVLYGLLNVLEKKISY